MEEWLEEWRCEEVEGEDRRGGRGGNEGGRVEGKGGQRLDGRTEQQREDLRVESGRVDGGMGERELKEWMEGWKGAQRVGGRAEGKGGEAEWKGRREGSSEGGWKAWAGQHREGAKSKRIKLSLEVQDCRVPLLDLR